MPEIDRELFQLVLLALMGIAVLLLLVLISTLGGIRKALKEQVQETRRLADAGGLGVPGSSEPTLLPSAPVDDRPPSLQTPDPSHYGIDDTDDRPLVGGAATPGAAHIASPAAEPETSPEPFTPATETPAAEPAGAQTRAPWDQLEEDDGGAAQVGETPAALDQDPTATPDPFAEPAPADATEPASEQAGADTTPETDAAHADFGEPFGSETPGSQDVLAGTPGSSTSDPFLTGEDDNPFMRDADQPAPQSTLDEPEEQPFERNGRWFFKREGELLVYEEGTGEWVPAESADAEPPKAPPGWSPPETSEAAATSPAGLIGDTPTDTAELDAVEAEEEPRPVAGGGFWKCPSCGAVNGSSAATCRMCFSARP